MIERIIQKIEHIRSLPEHIRLRYTVGAVIVCMLFVIGVWLLTLKQGFQAISPEVSGGKDQAEETLDNLGESFPSTDSLKTLKENSGVLNPNSTSDNNAEEFLNQELERKPSDQLAPTP